MDEQDTVPYQALNYIVAAANYGGRVTDDKDVALSGAMLKRCFCPEIMNDNYKLSKLDTYYAPPDGSLKACQDYIEGLPLEEDPEVFGLHPNANRAYEKATVGHLTDTVIMMQPRVAESGVGKTPDELAQDLCRDIGGRCPAKLDNTKAHPDAYKEASPG